LQKPFAELHHCPVLNIPTASLFVGIATLLVTGYIAWQQWQTAKNKLRLDLFNRRFSAFEAAMKLVSMAAQEEDVSDEVLQEFLIATKGAQFLFNQKLQGYCEGLAKEAINLHVYKQRRDLQIPGELLRAVDVKIGAEVGRRVGWFSDQVYEIPKRFAPFLRIRG
jgi:hypothetical protein